jgi:Zn finger protein HypA/HybF involved in hydrogenase expression
MHEHAIIDSVLSNLKDVGKVKEAHFEVGELAGIEPNHLKEHLKDRVKFKVVVKKKKSVVKCECGYKGPPKILEILHDMVIYECPKCGKLPRILEGKDIKITKVIKR